MADVDIQPSFGRELKVRNPSPSCCRSSAKHYPQDGFKPVNAWVSTGIAWLDDVQAFYRERSAIEKEYAGKLSALAKKYFEKKAKKSSALSVGENPVVTPGSLESASMSTWTTQLTTLEQRAAEHDKFAASLVSQLAQPLQYLAARTEELRKLHADYAAKLEKERDGAYGDLRKMKGKYDGVCQEVENRRKKFDGAFDHGKSRAQVAYQQQVSEMHNIKNTYIISINVTNVRKSLYYHSYVPELLDSLQDLNETRVSKLNAIWALAAQIEASTLTRSTEYLNHLSNEIPRNRPNLDSMMFARHNATNWQEPPNVAFEPSPVWLDEPNLAVDEAAKNFLRNVLTKSKSALSQMKKDEATKKREVEGAKMVRQKIRDGKDKRDEIEIVRALFDLQTSLHETERQKTTAEVEISTITQVVGDVSIGARNHNFKSETFKIPTNCDHCGERIWGLSAKGFSCNDCGFTCHSKCEMKIPADCPGEQTKEEKKKLKLERQEAARTTNSTVNGQDGIAELPSISRSDTMNTLSSGYSANARRSISGSTLAQSPSELEDTSTPKPAPTPAGGAGRKHRIVAPPPTAYVSDAGANGSSSDLPKAGEQRAKTLYPYQQNGDGEISVEDGKDVVVMEPDGKIPYSGKLTTAKCALDGSGWTKVRHGGDEGLVPTSYIEITPVASSPNRPASTYSNSSVSVTGSVNTGGKKKGPAVAPKRGAKKLKYVEAMYEYEARSDMEHSMAEGERFVLINKDAGDGWAEVEKGGAVKSVPANYIQEV